jgi:hypothetical protein
VTAEAKPEPRPKPKPTQAPQVEPSEDRGHEPFGDPQPDKGKDCDEAESNDGRAKHCS